MLNSNNLLIGKNLLTVLFSVSIFLVFAGCQTFRADNAGSTATSEHAINPAAANKINVSSDELPLLYNSLNPESAALLTADPAERKQASKNILLVFALAEEAKRAGVADRPEVKRQLELARLVAVSQNYAEKQQLEKDARQFAPPNEIQVFLREPGREEEFAQVWKDFSSPDSAEQKPNESDRETIKKRWATAHIYERKAVAAGLDNNPAPNC